jgi:hypothetical protein
MGFSRKYSRRVRDLETTDLTSPEKQARDDEGQRHTFRATRLVAARPQRNECSHLALGENAVYNVFALMSASIQESSKTPRNCAS